MRNPLAVALSLLLASIAAAQAPPFRVLNNLVPPTSLNGDAVGDLDGDGDQDLLCKGGLYLNDGHGRFTAAPGNPLAFTRSRTVIADFDGNGFQDVVSMDDYGIVRLDFNVGGLAFVPSTALQPMAPGGGPAYAMALAAADVDLDADVDVFLVVAQGFGAIPVLWLNNGSAVFTLAPPGNLPAAFPYPGSYLALRDLDNNGYPDAIFAGNFSPSIQCAMNTAGVFAFSPAYQWSLPGYSPYDLDVGDFNGDGLPDLAVASSSTHVNINSPSGFTGFVSNPLFTYRVQAVDLNGDGSDEVVLQVSGLEARSIGPGGTLGPVLQSWPSASFLVVNAPGQESLRDLDGDGDRDLAVRIGILPSLLMNDGSGSLVHVGGQGVGLSGVRIGDVNADGSPDVVGAIYAYGTGAPSIATGLNDGDGFFLAGPTTPLAFPGASSYSLFTFDRDGDGDCDVYAARGLTGPNSGNDVVYDNVGGSFIQAAVIQGTGDTAVFQAADLDADGDQDVLLGRHSACCVTGNTLTGPMLFIRNLSPGSFAPPASIGGIHSTYDLDLGDFDGNGTMDVFQTNKYFGVPLGGFDPCVLYLNMGATYTAVPQGFSGTLTAAGDLNGDGLTDLVVDTSVLFSTGSGTFVAGPALPAMLATPPELADVDLDGDLDLVQAPATIMLNSGGGNFGPPTAILPLSTGVRPEIVDVDRDGDPDIVAEGPIVVSNVTRQIAHGSWPRPGRPASIEIYGTPNGVWYLFASNGTASFPFPPFGTALIDPASAFLAATGTFAGPAAANPGTATFGGIVPNNPALVGWATYWQGFDVVGSRVTNRLTAIVLNY